LQLNDKTRKERKYNFTFQFQKTQQNIDTASERTQSLSNQKFHHLKERNDFTEINQIVLFYFALLVRMFNYFCKGVIPSYCYGQQAQPVLVGVPTDLLVRASVH
jgi:hypothetical protein